MADITFVTAGIGGGKSLYATRMICHELRTSDRMIVTNVPVFFDKAKEEKSPSGEDYMTLQEWCQEFCEHPVDVSKRVRILTKDEVYNFWLHLPQGLEVPEIEENRPNGKKEIVPDLQWRQERQMLNEIPYGCFFLIDEVHLHFPAREWTKIGNTVERYMSQLRKLNDDLFLITQHMDKVDKNFRRNATETIELMNMSKKRLFGGVTLRGRFRYQLYQGTPMLNDKPMQSGWMQLEDEKYHLCYDTMAGVGLAGKSLPEGSRMKGRHWTWWLVIFGAIMLVAMTVPKLLMKSAGAFTGSMIKSVQGGVSSKLVTTNQFHAESQSSVQVTNTAEQVQAVAQSQRHYASVNRPAIQDIPQVDRSVYVDGMSLSGNLVTVFLSNGDSYYYGDGHLTRVDKTFVIIDDVVYRIPSLNERLRMASENEGSASDRVFPRKNYNR